MKKDDSNSVTTRSESRRRRQSCLPLWAGAVLVASVLAIACDAQTQSGQAKDDAGLTILSGNLSLSDALAMAEASNFSIHQARADADIAAAASRGARAQTLPGISTTTYGALGDSSNIVTSSPGVVPQSIMGVQQHGFADQNITVMAPLYTGGKLAGLALSARRQSDAASWTERASELAVRQSVTDAYADALLKRALVDVAASRVDAEQEQVRVTQAQVDTGHSAPVDLLREQAELADANRMKTAAESDAAQALLVLDTALGASLLSNITPSDSLADLAVRVEGEQAPSTQQAAMERAAHERPEIAASARQVEAAVAEVGSAKDEYSPQVYAVGMADATAMDQASSRVGYTVGLSASLPLYDGGQRRADVDGAEAKVRRAEADALSTRQQVMQQAAAAWLALQSAKSQLISATAGLDAAQQGYDLANIRYNAGKSVTAERLDALAALTRAQGDLATAREMVVSASADLAVAMGNSVSLNP